MVFADLDGFGPAFLRCLRLAEAAPSEVREAGVGVHASFEVCENQRTLGLIFPLVGADFQQHAEETLGGNPLNRPKAPCF